jgi:large subunit ribosomal protein L7/L12
MYKQLLPKIFQNKTQFSFSLIHKTYQINSFNLNLTKQFTENVKVAEVAKEEKKEKAKNQKPEKNEKNEKIQKSEKQEKPQKVENTPEDKISTKTEAPIKEGNAAEKVVEKIEKPVTPLTKSPDSFNKYKTLISDLNKDWKKISEEKELYRFNKIKEDLLPSQRKFIELLADKIINMNNFQIQKVLKNYTERTIKLKHVAPITIVEPWLELQKQLGNKIPEDGAKFPHYEEMMKDLSKWYISQNPSFGIGSGPAVAAVKEEKVVEKKEEKKEKEAYDIELTSFEPAKKIVLIKEVRALLNLGLKEAKELVEKAPTVIMKGVKKAETEAVLNKFKEHGAVMTLK